MPTTPSRRTILRVAAWTPPAIVVVAAAPAFAASPSQVDIAVAPVCETYNNSALRISATGTSDIPAGMIVTLVNAGSSAWSSVDGRITPHSDASFTFPSLIPAGGYGLIYFQLGAAYPTPGIVLTLPAGYSATATSTLTGSTTYNACSASARRSTPRPLPQAP